MAAVNPYTGEYASASSVGPNANVGELSSQHPEYICHAPDWEVMRDVYAGQRAVKEKGYTYLPPTSGMIADGLVSCHDKGSKAYAAYLCRALFHGFVREAVATALGMLWNKPSTYEMPTSMDFLREKASATGGGLAHLHREVNRQQLVTGRLGLLTDLPETAGSGAIRPYLALYHAERIVNWDAGFRGDSPVESTNLVVLDESGPKRLSTFQWEDVQQYRVLMLGDPDLNEASGIYRYGVFSDQGSKNLPSFSKDVLRAPNRHGREFDYIPWVFINADSCESTVGDPPLLGLADLCLAIYRLEADYRQSLFLQGQDTLFTKGFTDAEEKVLRTGVGARIHSATKDGDAKYIGVNSEGLPEMRVALENDIKRAANKAGEMMDASSRARESGDALEMRIGSKTATLNEIAIAGAEGMQKSLRNVARWMGLGDSEINKIFVKPNFEFASSQFMAMDFKALTESKLLGAPLSWKSIFEWNASRGGPGSDLSFEQVLEAIKAEVPFSDFLGPQIQPLDQANLDLQEQAQEDKAKSDMAAAKAPKPAAAPTRK